jgi:hypothetical protein
LGSEEVMMDVFVVQHVHEVEPDNEDVKLIGVYSSEVEASAAVARLLAQPGFLESPNGFHVDRYTVDKDQWTGGFATIRTESK